MNEYEVWHPLSGGAPCLVHADSMELRADGTLLFGRHVADHPLHEPVEAFAAGTWSRWRLGELDIDKKDLTVR